MCSARDRWLCASTGRSSPVPPATPTVNIQQQNAMGGWDWNRPATTSTGSPKHTATHTNRYHTVCKTHWHQCRSFFPLCCLPIHSGGFGMGSRSATTSPTGSVHSTPTHQTKPNTLDPFADIGNLGGSLGGETLEMFLSFWYFCYYLACRNLCPFDQEALASRASPPPLLERPLPSLQWAPHRGLHHLPSTQDPGSPTQEALSPRGRLVEVVEGGNHKDRVLLRSQSPAPATLPCRTHRPRIDPTTMLASPQWEEAHPAQGENHRLGWVSSRGSLLHSKCCGWSVGVYFTSKDIFLLKQNIDYT